MLKRYPRTLLGGLMLLVVLLGTIVVAAKPATSPSSPIGSTSAATTFAGTITSDLGTRSNLYGSDWQGIELLKSINANPNTARFVISANDGRGERLELIADRSSDTLERKHWTSGGKGTSELWKGNVRERALEAATGDGFNYGTGTARGPILSSI